MAIVTARQLAAQLRGLTRIPLLQQLGLMAGLAASVALGVAIVLWSQTPRFSPLYGNLSDSDASDVVAALQRQGVEYQINERTGTILVPARDLHETRLQLASAGLPKGNGIGFELLDQQPGFGTSEFMETARYHRALEGELARTITSVADIRSVRVHLALPKRSVFVRAREKPSASILVNLFPGQTLEPNQVQAIVHLVSASVPNLEASRVTIIDQKGHLLSSRDGDQGLELSMSQFEYTHRLEQAYMKRIEDILTPILGTGRVRAQVVADLDFSIVESTEELFNPDPKAIRSEQLSEQRNEASAAPLGIPGALSNQPPRGGTLEGTAGGAGEGETPSISNRNQVRNFEIDRTIKHVRSPVGVLKRLSVAVVVDDVVGSDEEGNPITKNLDPAELENLTNLVKKAVGFDEERGDSVHIVNTSFQPSAEEEPVAETALWRQPWLWDLVKQAGGILILLFLVMGVLRPVMRSLAERGLPAPTEEPALAGPDEGVGLPSPDQVSEDQQVGEDQLSLGSEQGGVAQLAPPNYEDHVNRAQTIVSDNPKLVASVVKDWLADDV